MRHQLTTRFAVVLAAVLVAFSLVWAALAGAVA